MKQTVAQSSEQVHLVREEHQSVSSSLCDFTLTDADLFPPALKESQRGEKHSVVPRYLIWAENTSGNEVAGDVRQ